MFLTLCDVQILTGFGLLFSSFVGLTCYMSAYHWQIISYLAWFSNLTHAACLTALREYLYHHKMERNFRMMLMIVLMAGLITAIVPTGYFNWGDLDDKYIIWDQGTAGVPASNARCFFSQRRFNPCGKVGYAKTTINWTTLMTGTSAIESNTTAAGS
ncbi:hypothetical protein CGMCC3_g1249 [Colletotrichum fructicola]|nr:uncharacterized protein CGMCC3_g1249 [Colletotrichum fructicola]KAE9582980.1 hypothetical protein CGMCC3_g1249 [Colletotrichum fructicola]